MISSGSWIILSKYLKQFLVITSWDRSVNSLCRAVQLTSSPAAISHTALTWWLRCVPSLHLSGNIWIIVQSSFITLRHNPAPGPGINNQLENTQSGGYFNKVAAASHWSLAAASSRTQSFELIRSCELCSTNSELCNNNSELHGSSEVSQCTCAAQKLSHSPGMSNWCLIFTRHLHQTIIMNTLYWIINYSVTKLSTEDWIIQLSELMSACILISKWRLLI